MVVNIYNNDITISKKIDSLSEVQEWVKDKLNNNEYFTIEDTELYEEEKKYFISAEETYMIKDNSFILVNRSVINSINDSIERYKEDYTDKLSGTKFKRGDIVTLDPNKYPEMEGKSLVVRFPSTMNKDKLGSGYTKNYWNNLYALEYTDENGNVDYYTYDMVHEKYICRVES